jgi:hypothetical protein
VGISVLRTTLWEFLSIVLLLLLVGKLRNEVAQLPPTLFVCLARLFWLVS